MSHSKEELIAYYVKRAEDALKEAKLLIDEEYFNTAMNRLYYACFYVVTALLEKHDLEAKTHSGTKILFNEHYLKDGIFNKNIGKLYATLFDKRQEGDYAALIEFKHSDVSPYYEKSLKFVSRIKNHISN